MIARWVRFGTICMLFGCKSLLKLGLIGLIVKRERLHFHAGAEMARLAERLGPAAIKLAQAVSARRDLLPATFLEPLGRLQDSVRPITPKQTRCILEAAYGQPLSRFFRHLGDSPIASGSVAVVLRGTTVEGDDVAIKVVRPGVEASLRADLKCVRLVANILARRRSFSSIPIVSIVDELADRVLRQCNMELEAGAAIEIGQGFAASIIIPKPRRDLSRRHVLVMEFVESEAKFSDKSVEIRTFETCCIELLRAVYRMIFVLGIVHCDLHPGNVGIRRNGDIVLYDFGLVAIVSEGERRLFRELFIAVARRDVATVAKCIIVSSVGRPALFDEAGFNQEIGEIVQQRGGQRAGDFSVVNFIRELFEIQRRHKLVGTPGFAGAIWALLMFEGLVRERFPTLDFQAEALPFAISGFLQDHRRLM